MSLSMRAQEMHHSVYYMNMIIFCYIIYNTFGQHAISVNVRVLYFIKHEFLFSYLASINIQLPSRRLHLTSSHLYSRSVPESMSAAMGSSLLLLTRR